MSSDSEQPDDDRAEFGLIRSFDVDDGQLDGLSPQQCFVLGYELAEVDAALERPEQFERPVHAHNRERIEKACEDAEREYQLTWMPADSSEGWMHLRVVAASPEEPSHD